MHIRRSVRITLRQLILLLVITSVAIMLVGSMLGAYRVQRQQLIDGALTSNEVFAVKLASMATDLLGEAQDDLAYSAGVLERGEMDPVVVRSEITRLRRQGLKFDSVVVVGADGAIRAISPVELAPEGHRIDSAQSLTILRRQVPQISQPFVTILGNLAIALSQPLFAADRRYLGYVAATLYLKTGSGLNRLIGEQFFHDGTIVYVVDSSGRVLYHPSAALIGTRLASDPAADAALQGSSGRQRVRGAGGEDVLDGYAHVARTDWGVVVQRPTQAALHGLSDLMARILLLAAAPAALLLILLTALAYWVSHPLEQLARIVRSGYRDGMVDEIRSVRGWYYEAQQLKQAVLVAVERVRSQMVKLHSDAYTDPLTGLGNRRRLETVLQSWQALGRSFAVLSLDIDFFKRINDSSGHDVGDQVIHSVSDWMRTRTRRGDELFRTGGEEFLALLPGVTLTLAGEIAERLRASIEGAPILEGHPVTVSVGVSAWSGGDVDAALKAADQALYRAKQGGRNRVVTAADLATRQR